MGERAAGEKRKMLLINGVKYELWTPPNEDEFEQMVKEHTKEIFGEASIYLDLKQKLKSKSGIGSIPDGYVIVFGDSPCWHIVEAELSSHPLYEHIVPQTSKFINGIRNPHTQREITDAIFEEINKDDILKLKVKRAIEPTEIYRFLTDLVSKPPVVTIIIEKHAEALNEALSALAHHQVKIIEFQTFVREGIGLSVHAHLFEPLYRTAPPKVVGERVKDEVIMQLKDVLEIIIKSSSITGKFFRIPKDRRRFFPGYKVPFILVTDIGEIETYVAGVPKGTSANVGDPDAGEYIVKNLPKWYMNHPEIKVGDKVVFEVIEPMKKYRLRKA